MRSLTQFHPSYFIKYRSQIIYLYCYLNNNLNLLNYPFQAHLLMIWFRQFLYFLNSRNEFQSFLLLIINPDS